MWLVSLYVFFVLRVMFFVGADSYPRLWAAVPLGLFGAGVATCRD